MAGFDPESFLAKGRSPNATFDPERFIARARAPRADDLPAPAKPVTLDALGTGLFHGARHLAAGLGDKIIAAEEALSEKLHDRTGNTSFGDAYRRDLSFNDQLLENSDAAHPTARWVGNGVGLIGNTAALAAVAPARAALAARGLIPAAESAAPAAGILARTLHGATEGAKAGGVFGAVGGLGGSRSDSAVGTALDAGIGGIAGTLFGGSLGGAGGAASGKLAARAAPQPSQFVRPESLPLMARGVTPTAEAQILQKYGVPLTLGQMQPGGLASEVEEAAGRVPFLGKAIESQRKAGENAWREAVLRQSMPGEGPMVGGDTMDRLGDIQGQIRAAYQSVSNSPAKIAAVHPQTGELVNPTSAFKAILEDPNYQASDSDLRVVHGVLKDQLGKLYRTTEANRLSQNPSIKAGLLMDMRSELRDAAQHARLSGNFSTSQMLQDAADSVGGGIKASIHPLAAAALDNADSAYSKFVKIADAARRAGSNVDEGEFSPQRLSSELQRSYGRKFATDRDAGGALRELARAGKSVFTPRDVKTGHGELGKSAVGYSLGPLVYRANANPEAQAAFFRAAQEAEASGQRMMPPVAGGMERSATGALDALPSGTIPAGLSAQMAMAAALRNRSTP